MDLFRKLWRSYTNPSSSSKYTIVGRTFHIVMLLLKSVGQPVSIQNVGESYGKATWFEYVYAVTGTIFSVAGSVIYTLNRGFDVSWPIRLWSPLRPEEVFDLERTQEPPSFVIWASLTLQALLPLSSVVYFLLGHRNRSSFLTFLNEWPEFLKFLDNYFKPYSYIVDFSDLKRYRNWCLICTFVPNLFLSFFFVPHLLESKVLPKLAIDVPPILTFIVTMCTVDGMLAGRIVHNIKDFLSLRVLQTAYREVRQGVDVQYKFLDGKVTQAQVRDWMHMIMFIRSQRTLFEQNMGFQNIWLLIEVFVVALLVLTASVVVLLHEIQEYYGWVAAFSTVVAGLIIFLFYKGQLAEEIAEEEDLFTDSVIAMTAGRDCDARLEMKSLCNMTFHDGIKIKLGYVLVLNKRLMLNFCTHLTASLIILLQFANR